MRPTRLLPVVLTLAWGLWFGGLITLFIAVTSIFNTFAPDRATAGTAAAGVFHRFELYQLGLAAVAVIAGVAWRASRAAARRRRTLVLVPLVLAAGLALVSTGVVSSRIHDLRKAGQTATAEFRTLHGLSMGIYASEAALLLAAGLALPGAVAASKQEPPD